MKSYYAPSGVAVALVSTGIRLISFDDGVFG